MRVCPNCGSNNSDDATFCIQCGYDLVDPSTVENKPDTKFCYQCGGPMAMDALFCPRCGGKYEEQTNRGSGKTEFFGALQESGKAKLTVIRGGGFDGVSYQLTQSDHLAGREEGFLHFPDDPLVSPRHCNFFYFGNKLFVSDEGSLNGIYTRISLPVELQDGSHFRCGEQLFRCNIISDVPALPCLNVRDDDTKFLGSPDMPEPCLMLTQVLETGLEGAVSLVKASQEFLIGRENCNINYPMDAFMSGRHCVISQKNGKFYLADKGSKNGTFHRIGQEQELRHGDLVFLGQQLLRVEIV